jgi:hypothetical protein
VQSDLGYDKDGAKITSFGPLVETRGHDLQHVHPVPMPSLAPPLSIVLTNSIIAHELNFAETSEPGFRGELRKAIREARKANSIDARTAFKLQTMTFSPAFVAAAQELAVAQMVLSGQNPEKIPLDEDGRVDVAGINWAELGKFLQLLLPILLEFLKGLGL